MMGRVKAAKVETKAKTTGVRQECACTACFTFRKENENRLNSSLPLLLARR